ncbi:hypothetical protein [Klebsiella quasipneumoniae]|uniref:hypothetical protein n=1 Tax=Klebsiella quasipneumoniae TaxID=1463165 RepID=UPI002B05EA0E|nr:hypothetical protein [Klebsiella quasipneumoniae]
MRLFTRLLSEAGGSAFPQCGPQDRHAETHHVTGTFDRSFSSTWRNTSIPIVGLCRQV